MQIVRNVLAEVRLGAARAHANLTLFPLFTPAPGARSYGTLDEALASGKVRVTETSKHGSVPELCVVNGGDRPVLLLDGEELHGAKQNRVLNLTILVAAGATVVVPVSCVERGRWAWRSEELAASPQVLYARSRAAMAVEVAMSLAGERGPHADQGRVWASIDEKLARLGTRSDTRAMADAYAGRAREIDAFVAAFPAEAGQTGAVFALDGRVAGAELFDHPDALSRVFPKIVRSWALDAIESPPHAGGEVPVEAARAFLDAVAQAEMTPYPAVGQGSDVRLRGERLSGGALVHDGRVVHLSAFRIDREDASRPEGGMIRASWRHR